MVGLVAQGSQAMGELTDQLRGTRKLKDHPHHKAQDLTDAVIDDIAAIITLRKKIQNKKG